MRITPLILCGGSGTRLWPLSRALQPKQFMDLGGQTLFGKTLDRLGALDDCGPPIVVCNRDHRFLVAEQLLRRGLEPGGSILLEPAARNTAPAICAAALAALDSGRGGCLLALPSDHAIKDVDGFGRALLAGRRCVDDGMLATFGVVPAGPESGYGYIRRGDAIPGGYRVGSFVEKPDFGRARAMLESGGYYWNSGIFMFSAGLFLEQLGRYEPQILEYATQAWQDRTVQHDFVWLGEAFGKCPSISVDYAVMEKTPDAAVVPLDVGWSDLGSWKSIHEAGNSDERGNLCVGDVLARDSRNCYLHSSGRLLAALGLNNLVVVETGDAVLVADRERSQEVKKIVEGLAESGRPEKESPLRVPRPWGWYESLALGERFQVKRIQVRSGASLSLQRHGHRAEHWVVVRGTGQVRLGDRQMALSANESVYIPIGVMHRLANESGEPLEIIEIQSGEYLGEDDIVRFDDCYGRN